MRLYDNRLICVRCVFAAAALTNAHAQRDSTDGGQNIPSGQSNLWRLWDLGQGAKGHTFRLLPNLPTYFLPV
jgi:hypothetical protein